MLLKRYGYGGELSNSQRTDRNIGMLQGAGSGAAAGAAIGSIIPGVGTVIGGAIGGIGGALYGGYQSIKESKFNNDFQKKMINTQLDNKINSFNSVRNTGNNNTLPYYKLGGRIASDSYMFNGNSHEQGGIKTQFGEVEGGELMVGDKIYSTRLGVDGKSFSSLAKPHTLYKAKIEDKLGKTSDKYKTNSLLRELDYHNKMLDELFNTQELQKGEYDENNKFAFGGEIDGSPYKNSHFLQTNIDDGTTTYGLPLSDFNRLPTRYPSNNRLLSENMIATNPFSLTPNNTIDTTTYGLPLSDFNRLPTRYPSNNRLLSENMIATNPFSLTPNNTIDTTTPIGIDTDGEYASMAPNSTDGFNMKAQDIIGESQNTDKSLPRNNKLKKLLNNPNVIDSAIVGTSILGNIMSNNKLKNLDLPTHELTPFVNLDKNLDISSQLQSIKDTEGSIKSYMTSNSSNSNSAASKIANLLLTSTGDKNKLFSDKVNYSNQVKNQEQLTNLDIDARNKALQYDDALSKYNLDVQTKFTNPSAIRADAYDKINSLITNNKMEKFQNRQLDIYEKVYNKGWKGVELVGTTPDFYSGLDDNNLVELYNREKHTGGKYFEMIKQEAKKRNLKVE